MNYYPSKKSKYEHVFVVLRVDDNFEGPVDEGVYAVSTYFRQDEADQECARLNSLGKARYVVLLSRLKGTR